MGTFNMLKVLTRCPNCNEVSVVDIQYRFGYVWQLRYYIGDKIRWEGPVARMEPGALINGYPADNILGYEGEPGAPRAIVQGIWNDCTHCGFDLGDCNIVLENDTIIGVRTPGRDLNQISGGYVIETG